MDATGRYRVVCCDPADGTPRPHGMIHWAVSAPDGEATAGTCPTLLASNAWFVDATDDDLRARVFCRVCHSAAEVKEKR